MATHPTSDENAFRDAFRECFEDVYRYVHRRCQVADTEAVVGEVFLIAWRQWSNRPSSHDEMRPWLFGIARNTLRSTERRELQRRDREQRSDLRQPSQDVSSVVVGQIHNDEQSAHIRTALSRLSERDQEVVMLAAWEELDAPAIAVALNISSATARVRIHRARRRLQPLLAEPIASPAPYPRKAAT